MLRRHGLAARVGGECHRRVGQREDEAAVADAVTVRHRLGDRHRQPRTIRRDLVQPHAQTGAGAILGPHRLGPRAHRIIHPRPRNMRFIAASASVGCVARCAVSFSASGCKRRVIHHAPDHPPGLGAFGVHRLAEHCQRTGARLADQPRQEEAGAGIRHQADLHERLDEPRAAPRQHDVAGQRVARPGTGGHAIDRAHHRQRHAAQPAHDAVMQVGDGTEIGRTIRPRHHRRPEFLSRAEASALAGQQQRAAGAIRLGIDPARRAARSASPHSPRSACRAGSAPACASPRAVRSRTSSLMPASATPTMTQIPVPAAALRPACR